MKPEKTDDLFQRIRFRGDPVANPESVVTSGDARFTVLTSRLLRMEWSETGVFEDRPTYAFPTRHAPIPTFTRHVEGDELIIDTGSLTLRHRQGSGPFTAGNLAIAFTLNGEKQTWVPGMENPSNLRGTRRTLDMCEGDATLEQGILSRAGWALFDDSNSVVFNLEDGWVAPRPEHALQDWVFFGYGRDYKAALADYAHFGGSIPLIPRFILGAWWSRYWAYSDQDLKDLVNSFGARNLPLDVLVIDMDWHTPDSWTGYTWNRDLFPDPAGFLNWAHEKGLRVTLNLHPAEGIQHFEEVYPAFAEAMGVDPETGETIPFRITDKKFVRPYFELIHHPMEEQGIDFWWMDWQQGETSEMKGLDPLPWINHLHFHDSTRRGKRGMLYSRWGGLGNHRYPIGFSGDTVVIWPALRFQPYHTSTAANVAFGWWSHDIGGHMGGATEPELYARWVQFGALSPVLRLHATKDPRAERRPWKYPPRVFEAAKAAFHLRYRLIPYIYTMARVAHETNLSLCRPMYYEYPEADAAYAARFQYFFGDQMIAAPIVDSANPSTGLAATDVWLPEGTWIDYETKETYTGPRWVRLVGDLDRVPMLMKAGAILPLSAPFNAPPEPHLASGITGAIPADRLVLSIFPGESGSFHLYEDDGITEAYKAGEYEWTPIETRMERGAWTVHISPVEGQCAALPAERQIDLRLEGCRKPKQVTIDGEKTGDWSYDAETLTTVVRLPMRDKGTPLTIIATADGAISALGPEHNQRVVLNDVRRLLRDQFPRDVEDPDTLIDAILALDAPGRDDAVARLGGPFARVIPFVTLEEASQQLGRVIVGAPATGDPYDLTVTFTRFRGDGVEQHTICREELTTSQIVDTPFAFEGQIEKVTWEAEAVITWRGHTLMRTYRSRTLFPAITTWDALVFADATPPVALDEVIAGQVNQEAGWTTYTQRIEEMANLTQPYLLLFDDEIQAQLRAGALLSSYLTATIHSPQAQDAALLFRSAGPAEFYLNGHPVGETTVAGDAAEPFTSYPYLRAVRRTPVVRLRAGENRLVVKVQSPRVGEDSRWYFGAAVVTLQGRPV
jgi:alpha-glucosidase